MGIGRALGAWTGAGRFSLRIWRVSRFSARLTGLRQRNAAPAVAALQTRTYAEAKASPTEVSSILEQRIRGVQEESGLAETGRVLSVGYVFQSLRRLGGEQQPHGHNNADVNLRLQLLAGR